MAKSRKSDWVDKPRFQAVAGACILVPQEFIPEELREALRHHSDLAVPPLKQFCNELQACGLEADELRATLEALLKHGYGLDRENNVRLYGLIHNLRSVVTKISLLAYDRYQRPLVDAVQKERTRLAQSTSGHKTTKKRRKDQNIDKRNARWCERAQELWRAHPFHSRANVARLIRQELALPEKMQRTVVRTIRHLRPQHFSDTR